MKDNVTTTMSTRGRVVIPKAVRDRAGLKAGDVVTLQLVDDAIHLRRAGSQTAAVTSFHHDAAGFYAWLNAHAPDGFFLVVGRNMLHRAGLCVHFGTTAQEALCTVHLEDLVAGVEARGITPKPCGHCLQRGLLDDDDAHQYFGRRPQTYPDLED